MAEASSQDIILQRYFCHKCSVEIPRVLPDYTCPNCGYGFIEEIDGPPERADDSDIEMEDAPPRPMRELLNHRLGEELNGMLLGVGNGVGGISMDERRVLRSRDREPSDSRRPGRYMTTVPRSRVARNRASRGRQVAPIENLIQEFLVNLTGVGWGAVGGNRGGNVFFLGNPGDYAWGREGLDAIVTQLLNQMDGAGPPPLPQDRIRDIPIVGITQDQVDKALQCSICWEDFELDEPVRKLSCDHVYHDNCIIPWLELHGTCPICRKCLAEEGPEDHQPGSGPGSGPGSDAGGGTNSMGLRPGLAHLFSLLSSSAAELL